MTMLIYKVSVLDYMGFERETNYYQHLEIANVDFYKKLDELKSDIPLADKDDLDGEEPIKIHELKPHQKDFVRSATLMYWESYHTDCGTEHDISHMELLITKHDLIAFGV
jgi:hypothetical protein